MQKPDEALLLKNQLCFLLYTVSRYTTKAYGPILQQFDITYPQYLVMLVLWERSPLMVTDISEALHLETNTLTPLLKRMEAKGLLVRQRSAEDERKVIVSLTDKGAEMKQKATCVPQMLLDEYSDSQVSLEELKQLRSTLNKMMNGFQEQLKG